MFTFVFGTVRNANGADRRSRSQKVSKTNGLNNRKGRLCNYLQEKEKKKMKKVCDSSSSGESRAEEHEIPRPSTTK